MWLTPVLLACLLTLVAGKTGGKGTQKYGRHAVGCNLEKTKSIEEQMMPDGDPLRLATKMQVKNVRDVPDSGGSFGVEVR